MAREVIFQDWCDQCLSSGDHEPAKESFTILWPGWKKPRTIDVCGKHLVPFTDMQTILESFGRLVNDDPPPPVGRPPAAQDVQTRGRSFDKQRRLLNNPDAYGCPVCFWLYNTRKTLGAHLTAQHKVLLRSFTEDELAAATAQARDRVQAL